MATKIAKLGAALLPLALLFALLGLGQNVVQAQEAGPQLLDSETVQLVLDGQIPQVETRMASAETYPTFNIRDHWGYGSDKVQVMMNAIPTQQIDFVIINADGSNIDRSWIVTQTPRDELFQRLGSMETSAFLSSGGKLLSTWNEGVCQIGSMFVMARSVDGTSFPTIRNFATTPIYYRLVSDSNSTWRMLNPNSQEGWRIWEFSGEVEVKLSPNSQEVCAKMSWNWDYQEQAPLTLVISDTTTVVGANLIVPITFENNTGKVFSIDARLQYSPTHLAFVAIDQAGTLSSGFQYILNTQTPGQIIITGQGTQPITAESGLMLSLKFRALRAGTVPVKLAGVQVSDVLINGGQIPVIGEYGEVTVNASLWTGAVYFWNQNRQLKDVTVTLSNGTETITATTGWDGGYTAPLPTTGTWTATFSKPKSEFDRSAVSSLDAAITHQRAAQLTSFGIPFMEWSADADNRAPITSYDANRILRFVAQYVDSDAACGQWRGEEITAEVTGPTSSGHITKMWLMCDVTGNWVPDGTVRAAEAILSPAITTTVISVEPLVVRVSSDQPFSGLALQFDQNVQAVTALGFDSVQPNGGFVPLASMTGDVSSIDLTIVPMEGTEVLIIETIAIDEYAEVSGPSLTLDPNMPLPCVLDPNICTDLQVRLTVEPIEIYADQKVTITITVTNSGPPTEVATNMTNPGDLESSWDDSFAAGETKLYTTTFQLDQSFTFTATATPSRPELRPADNKDFAIVTVIEEFPVIWLQIFLPTVGGGVRPPDGGEPR